VDFLTTADGTKFNRVYSAKEAEQSVKLRLIARGDRYPGPGPIPTSWRTTVECKFVVGQKVVCIDDYDFIDVLKVGSIYSIVWVGISIGCYHGVIEEGPCVELKDIKNPYSPVRKYLKHENPYAFNAKRFRALNKRPTETSIEVFKKLLTPNKQLERV